MWSIIHTWDYCSSNHYCYTTTVLHGRERFDNIALLAHFTNKPNVPCCLLTVESHPSYATIHFKDICLHFSCFFHCQSFCTLCTPTLKFSQSLPSFSCSLPAFQPQTICQSSYHTAHIIPFPIPFCILSYFISHFVHVHSHPQPGEHTEKGVKLISLRIRVLLSLMRSTVENQEFTLWQWSNSHLTGKVLLEVTNVSLTLSCSSDSKAL